MCEVHILWGESPEHGDKVVTYTFLTEAERDAFLLGVNEMDGWMGWRAEDAAGGRFCRECDEVHQLGETCEDDSQVSDGCLLYPVPAGLRRRDGVEAGCGKGGVRGLLRTAGCEVGSSVGYLPRPQCVADREGGEVSNNTVHNGLITRLRFAESVCVNDGSGALVFVPAGSRCTVVTVTVRQDGVTPGEIEVLVQNPFVRFEHGSTEVVSEYSIDVPARILTR